MSACLSCENRKICHLGRYSSSQCKEKASRIHSITSEMYKCNHTMETVTHSVPSSHHKSEPQNHEIFRTLRSTEHNHVVVDDDGKDDWSCFLVVGCLAFLLSLSFLGFFIRPPLLHSAAHREKLSFESCTHTQRNAVSHRFPHSFWELCEVEWKTWKRQCGRR